MVCSAVSFSGRRRKTSRLSSWLKGFLNALILKGVNWRFTYRAVQWDADPLAWCCRDTYRQRTKSRRAANGVSWWYEIAASKELHADTRLRSPPHVPACSIDRRQESTIDQLPKLVKIGLGLDFETKTNPYLWKTKTHLYNTSHKEVWWRRWISSRRIDWLVCILNKWIYAGRYPRVLLRVGWSKTRFQIPCESAGYIYCCHSSCADEPMTWPG